MSGISFEGWVRQQVREEPYWFHRMELYPDLTTPGWSDPKVDKLPHFGLPEDMHGMRVLDIGCAEGFFSFEAERRGAAEVIAIDSYPDGIRRFNLCKSVYGSKAMAYLTNVYDLTPRSFGTFDMIFFFGVLYHLRHPLLALDRILSVCTGTMLMQTATWDHPSVTDQPVSRFDPFGMPSGPGGETYDPTVFWRPNNECVRALLQSTGFKNVEYISKEPSISVAIRGESEIQRAGVPPDPMTAPWS